MPFIDEYFFGGDGPVRLSIPWNLSSVSRRLFFPASRSSQNKQWIKEPNEALTREDANKKCIDKFKDIAANLSCDLKRGN